MNRAGCPCRSSARVSSGTFSRSSSFSCSMLSPTRTKSCLECCDVGMMRRPATPVCLECSGVQAMLVSHCPSFTIQFHARKRCRYFRRVSPRHTCNQSVWSVVLRGVVSQAARYCLDLLTCRLHTTHHVWSTPVRKAVSSVAQVPSQPCILPSSGCELKRSIRKQKSSLLFLLKASRSSTCACPSNFRTHVPPSVTYSRACVCVSHEFTEEFCAKSLTRHCSILAQ